METVAAAVRDEQSEAVLAEAKTLCEAAFSADVEVDKPAPPILLLKNVTYADQSEWLVNSDLAKPDILPGIAEPGEMVVDPRGARVGTLVCIKEIRHIAGTYEGATSAYQIQWWARLVNWADGVVIDEESFMGGEPPSVIKSGADAYGDPPRDQFVEWLNLRFQ